MAKRIKPRMVEYARSLGATTKRGPDWYLVAEHLAEIANPELLKNEPAEGTPRPGRRQNQDDFFAMEVHRVMSVYDCGVRAACEKIARGKREVPLPARGGVRRYTVGSPWKGQKVRALETRYWRWLKREKKRQQEFRVTIRVPISRSPKPRLSDAARDALQRLQALEQLCNCPPRNKLTVKFP
jgi:hypothetical protein